MTMLATGFAPLPQPTAHDLLVFLVQLSLLIGLALILGRLASRVGLPAVVGELLTGVLIGPSLLGHLTPQLWHWLFPARAAQSGMINAVAQVGVILLVGPVRHAPGSAADPAAWGRRAPGGPRWVAGAAGRRGRAGVAVARDAPVRHCRPNHLRGVPRRGHVRQCDPGDCQDAAGYEAATPRYRPTHPGRRRGGRRGGLVPAIGGVRDGGHRRARLANRADGCGAGRLPRPDLHGRDRCWYERCSGLPVAARTPGRPWPPPSG